MIDAKKISKTIFRIISVFKSQFAAKRANNGLTAGYYNVNNFGDQLTPDIFKYFGLRPFHAPVWRYAEVVGVGSILHNLSEDYCGAILGSGFISEKDGKVFPKATVYLVRGHLTRQFLQLNGDTPVGDPGLIVDELYHDAICDPEPEWELGIIPHYIDAQHPSIQSLKGQYPDHTKIIDVRRSPREVVRDISKCQKIFSSSLHGLIAADSLGIPNRRIIISGKTIGGHFKFNDYYSCFGEKTDPLFLSGSESIKFLLSQALSVEPEKVSLVKKNIQLAIKRFVDNYMEKQSNTSYF